MKVWIRHAFSLMLLSFLVACQNQLAPQSEALAEPPAVATARDQQQEASAEVARTQGPANRALDDDASSSGWPTFRLNNQHTAVVGRSVASEEPLQRWQFDTNDVVESSPAIVDGVLYVGTFNQALHAINALSGEEIWHFPVGGLLRASPSIVSDVAYFGADDNRFYAVDAQTGSEIWSIGLGPGGKQSSPAYYENIPYGRDLLE